MTPALCQPRSTRPLPATGVVEAWLVRLVVASPEDSLNNDERRRATRFHLERDRRRFIARRVARREILASYLGIEPAALRYEDGPFGKPRVSGLEFSASQSEDLAMIAVSREPIGVDLEHVSHAGLAGSLEALRQWCCKEAAVKLGGEGMSVEPQAIRVRGETAVWGARSCWVKALAPSDEFIAAVAAEQPGMVTWIAR